MAWFRGVATPWSIHITQPRKNLGYDAAAKGILLGSILFSSKKYTLANKGKYKDDECFTSSPFNRQDNRRIMEN